jgi:hypothetical protein
MNLSKFAVSLHSRNLKLGKTLFTINRSAKKTPTREPKKIFACLSMLCNKIKLCNWLVTCMPRNLFRQFCEEYRYCWGNSWIKRICLQPFIWIDLPYAVSKISAFDLRSLIASLSSGFLLSSCDYYSHLTIDQNIHQNNQILSINNHYSCHFHLLIFFHRVHEVG